MRILLLKLIYSVILKFYLKLIIGVNFSDTGFLKNEKSFILVANHNSHLDTIALLASLPSELIGRVKPVAGKDYFGKTKLSGLLSMFFINSLLVSRRINEDHYTNPIKSMINELDQGYSLIVFPEGSRGDPEQLSSFKKGISLVLLERPNICFIPVFLYGFGRALPKGDSIILPFNSYVRFGKPEFIDTTDNKEMIIEKIQDRITSLREDLFSNF